MDLDKEIVLQDLTNFNKVANESDQIPEQLEKYLVFVAKTGDTLFPWSSLKPLVKRKIELISNEFNEKFPYEPIPNSTNVQMFKPFQFEEISQIILEAIESFYDAPFTIQRLCELITCPYKHYKRTDKFMRALEKNVLVVSTAEPRQANDSNEITSRKPKESLLHTCSTSVYVESSSASITTYVNGVSEMETQSITSKYTLGEDASASSQPAPLQQLDSFTTVFASNPSTPLDVVSDIQTFDTKSPLSSESSDSNSPQSAGSPLGSSTERNNGNEDPIVDLLLLEMQHKNEATDSTQYEPIQSFDMQNTENTDPSAENITEQVAAKLVESISEKIEQQIKVEEAAKQMNEQFVPLSENHNSITNETPRKRVRSDSSCDQIDSENIPEKMCKMDTDMDDSNLDPNVSMTSVEEDNSSQQSSDEPLFSESSEPEETAQLSDQPEQLIVDETSSTTETINEDIVENSLNDSGNITQENSETDNVTVSQTNGTADKIDVSPKICLDHMAETANESKQSPEAVSDKSNEDSEGISGLSSPPALDNNESEADKPINGD